MKEKSDRSRALSASKQKLLSAFHDGELRGLRSKVCERLIAKGDGACLANLQNLRFIRSEVRGWYKQKILTRHSQVVKSDIWSSIEREVEKIADGYAERNHRPRLFGLALPVPLHAFPFRFAVLSVAMVFVAYIASDYALNIKDSGGVGSKDKSQEAYPINVVSLETEFKAVESLDSKLSIPEALVGESSDLDSKVAELPPKLRGQSSELQLGGSSVVRVVDREIGRNGVRDVREDGVDIDWIKSDSKGALRLFVSKNRRVPPVIWLASQNKVAR
ncbi:MAG: hypothetical protein IT291_08505 [Deltaproteobacteria bacterium]|nr:hypothetical protein [Deltaproteobacteria bacterium]